jgi:hypothetical protein
MPGLLRDAACAACGRHHHFTIPVGDVIAGNQYDYVCPETGTQAQLQPANDGENVRYAPSGAVVLSQRQE